MDNSDKKLLVSQADQLIKDIKAKGYSQKEIASLLGTSSSSLSKLKMLEYFPSNGDEMIIKLEKLKEEIGKSPQKIKGQLPEKKNPVSKYLLISILTISLFGNAYLLLNKENEGGVQQAFQKIFESNMQVLPYAEKPELPCYHYQRKWELDNENPYTIQLSLQDGVYYYRSKSTDFYAWCEIENKEGDKLEALELFTNELWKDQEKRIGNKDSLVNLNFYETPGFIKIAEISSIFSDIIMFEYNNEKRVSEPNKRVGKRIARYFPNEIKFQYKDEVMLVLDAYISGLSKTNCSGVTVFGNEQGYLPNNNLIMQFECAFFQKEDDGIMTYPYYKRLKRVNL